MEKKELERYKSMLREAFELKFSDEYITYLIGNIYYFGWMEGRKDGEIAGWQDGNSRI